MKSPSPADPDSVSSDTEKGKGVNGGDSRGEERKRERERVGADLQQNNIYRESTVRQCYSTKSTVVGRT